MFLTLEQLILRNGKPVYIVEKNGDNHWELCARGADYLQGRDITLYGENWFAYDREPTQEECAGLKAAYDAIVNLLEDLRIEIEFADADYKTVKALAACYELQEYLANRIATAAPSGELDVDGFTDDIFENGRE